MRLDWTKVRCLRYRMLCTRQASTDLIVRCLRTIKLRGSCLFIHWCWEALEIAEHIGVGVNQVTQSVVVKHGLLDVKGCLLEE
jgi:hypothetical protein